MLVRVYIYITNSTPLLAINQQQRFVITLPIFLFFVIGLCQEKQCSQSCVIQGGSAQCYCDWGFTLGSDGKTCIGKVTCREWEHPVYTDRKLFVYSTTQKFDSYFTSWFQFSIQISTSVSIIMVAVKVLATIRLVLDFIVAVLTTKS